MFTVENIEEFFACNVMLRRRRIGGMEPQAEQQTEPKKRGPYAKPTQKLAAVSALIEHGMDPKEALTSLGYSPKSVNGVVERIKEKKLGGFVTPKRVKSAVKVVDSFMEGRAIGDVRPKDSTVVACAAMVLDRAFPKQQDTGPQVQNTYTTVNLNFASFPTSQPSAPQVIDVSPPITSDNTPKM